MSRYNDLQTKGRKKPTTETKPKSSILNRIYNLVMIIIMITLVVVVYLAMIENQTPSTTQIEKPQAVTFDLTKRKWNNNQTKNLLIVEEASKYVNHPNPKRMGAHLLSESGATTVLDGDKVNGAFKKSYGIMQVKLGTVYYVRNKRPDLIKLYAPEVNALPKEDILDKLRKDPYFNAKLASLTHIVLIGVCGDQNRATVAYNRGFCEADELGTQYLNKILNHENQI